MKTTLTALALLVATMPAVAAAESLLCSLATIQVCTADGCERRSADDLGVPAFVVIDLEAKALRAVGAEHEGRESAFTVVENEEERLVLQGYENERAWSAVITDGSELVLAAAKDEAAFAVYGACVDTEEVTP